MRGIAMKSSSEKDHKFRANYKRVIIKTVDGELIIGSVNIGSKQRLSDIFTRSEQPFLIVVDANFRDSVGKVFFINKKHILWVEPESETE